MGFARCPKNPPQTSGPGSQNGQAPGSSSLFVTVLNSAHFIAHPLLFILAGILNACTQASLLRTLGLDDQRGNYRIKGGFTRMSEPPFRPREKLVEKQKFFQSIHKHTYLKGPYDKITSVAIPLALAGSSLYLIGKGIYNMSHGIGKKE
ncbi:hypothetical protein Sango_0486800 [Sesamum angolense]|uniref:Uncharacterized protein n=5 Tax=Sesamum TaxID=4181 RepID=A0AAE1XC28_9LAMI|nr:hypothetical protein Sango_0486800 [Sesamum angolense]